MILNVNVAEFGLGWAWQHAADRSPKIRTIEKLRETVIVRVPRRIERAEEKQMILKPGDVTSKFAV